MDVKLCKYVWHGACNDTKARAGSVCSIVSRKIPLPKTVLTVLVTISTWIVTIYALLFSFLSLATAGKVSQL